MAEDQKIGRPQRQAHRGCARRVINPGKNRHAAGAHLGLEPVHRLIRPVAAAYRDQAVRGHRSTPVSDYSPKLWTAEKDRKRGAPGKLIEAPSQCIKPQDVMEKERAWPKRIWMLSFGRLRKSRSRR